jgi:hypothetical protein
MNTDLAVAILSGAVALVSLGITLWHSSRQARRDRDEKGRVDEKLEHLRHDLDEKVRQQDRLLAAREVIDRYQRPLLAAAYQLERRLDNIRHRGFLGYLKADGHRAQVALTGTLYRFAAYLGWRELLTRELTYLEFEYSERTSNVLDQLDEVRAKLSSSRFDRQRLMLWTEEQSAIGGLMLKTNGTPGIIGFETFFEAYEDRFLDWFGSFAEDLAGIGSSSTRLRELETSLRKLIDTLDEEGVYGEHGWRNADMSRETAPPRRPA